MEKNGTESMALSKHAVSVDPEQGPDMEDMRNEKMNDLSREMAKRGTATEHDMGYWEAFVIYRKDIEILGNFYALPAFQKRFGVYYEGSGWQIPAKWQVAMSMGSLVGQILGAYLVTFPMERFGRKKTFAVSLCCTAALTFMQFFAQSIEVLTASQYLSGIVWGTYCVISTTYASEVLPLRLRGFLTGYINLSYVMGQFIQTGVMRGFISWTSEWAYRIPFAIQWNRMEDALKSLRRLSKPHPNINLQETLAMMVKTNILEAQLDIGTTYADCWKGVNRRRMEICVMLFVIQNFSGNPVGFATYLFEQTGLNSKQAFDIGVGLNGVGFVGTLMSAIPLIYFGRRSCYLFSITSIVSILFIVALLCLAHDYMTLGPLTYVVVCETPSTKLRSKTIAIATAIDALTGLVTTVIGPYLLNPGAAGAGAKIEFLYGGISVFSLTWCYFRLPETKSRTYEELDLMFEKRVPARKFKNYVIEGMDD
ncbi:uncharacterized protein N7458_010483 [Penicillium daleae]|uniref:Major facilitator superfamily (MFS) profile domain-containing protein n=1 Tax=Penicillium daleae TaxID=63821 RepID=A0AAD6BZT9_9EURO|nr:uncharacterized protein N7458_010483 [Penicillium daleae]KAJ5439485.1 hypothetical protein N7458_010483 [Penicillium daleae]